MKPDTIQLDALKSGTGLLLFESSSPFPFFPSFSLLAFFAVLCVCGCVRARVYSLL